MGRVSDARERLIEAASDLIHDRGYTAVGVNDVCERAQVNKGSFYHFFPSKQELALAVLEEYWKDQRERIEKAIQCRGCATSKLLGMFDAFPQSNACARARDGKFRGCTLGNLALELSTQDDRMRQRLDAIFDAWIDSLATLIDAAIRDGSVPQQNPKSTARALVALLEGLTMLAKTRNDPSILNELGGHARRLIFGGAEPRLPDRDGSR